MIENASMDIPQPMIDWELEQEVENFAQRITSQGLPFEQYLQFTGLTEEKFREEVRPQAEKGARVALLIENVAKAENIVATDEDIDAEVKQLAEGYGMEEDKVREIIMANLPSIKQDIEFRKTVKFLTQSAAN